MYVKKQFHYKIFSWYVIQQDKKMIKKIERYKEK